MGLHYLLALSSKEKKIRAGLEQPSRRLFAEIDFSAVHAGTLGSYADGVRGLGLRRQRNLPMTGSLAFGSISPPMQHLEFIWQHHVIEVYETNLRSPETSWWLPILFCG